MKRILEDIKINKNKTFVKTLAYNNDKHKTTKINNEKNFLEIISRNNKDDVKRINILKEKKIKIKPKLPKIKINIGMVLFTTIVILLIIGVIIGVSILFEKVNIVITPKHQIFNLNKKLYVAKKDTNSTIPFEIMIISDTKSESINLTESADVSLKSKGEIIFYNEYSKNPEKLVANTYISDENGKVYLTDKDILIPGYKEVNNIKIPGEVVVSATSFLPGDSYNGNPSYFTINAYKDTPKFSKIYAKNKTSFSGGANGLNYYLSDKDIENLNNIAKTTFKDNLIAKVDSLIPKEYIFYPNAYNFSYKINEEILSETPNASVDISGVLSVFILKKIDLQRSIIKDYITGINDEELSVININDIKNLDFNFINPNQIIVKELESVSFSLDGELDFIWDPNLPLLMDNLLGSSKSDLPIIFKKDVGIEEANVKIFPPWKKVLPNEIRKINIKVI